MTKKKDDLPDVGFELRHAETTGHKPATVLEETCILPVIETEEDFMILNERQAAAARAQGYKLNNILKEQLKGKVRYPQNDGKRFNVIATEDLNIGGKAFRSYQPLGDVLLLADSCNYSGMLDAGINAMISHGLATPMSDMHFGMRLVGDNVITIDTISNQPTIIENAGQSCRKAKNTVFPMYVDHIKVDRYPKYILDGRVDIGDVPGKPFMAREMKDDDMIPLHYSIAIASTCHGLMQVVFWGDVTLEEMKLARVFYKYGGQSFHAVFDDSEPYQNYLVIDSLSEFTKRRGITVGDPIIPMTGFNIDYDAWGGDWWENKEEADNDSGHELGRRTKEQNIHTARESATGKNPASAIMKKLLRSKK